MAWRRRFDDGSEANVRIYFKASKQVMDALAEKMPNRVNVPEELADFNMLVKEGVIVNNERKLREAEAEILDKSVEQLDAEEKIAKEMIAEQEAKEDAAKSKKQDKK